MTVNRAYIAADQNRHRVTNTGPCAALDQRVEQHAQVIVGQHDIGGPGRQRNHAPLHSVPTSAIGCAASLAPSPTIAITRPQRCSAIQSEPLFGLTRARLACRRRVWHALLVPGRQVRLVTTRVRPVVPAGGRSPRRYRMVAGDPAPRCARRPARLRSTDARRPGRIRQSDIADQRRARRRRQRRRRSRHHGWSLVSRCCATLLQALLGEVAYRFGMFVVDARVGESAARQDHLQAPLSINIGIRQCPLCRSRRRSRDWTQTVPARYHPPDRLGC